MKRFGTPSRSSRASSSPMFSGTDVSQTTPEQAAAINQRLERARSAPAASCASRSGRTTATVVDSDLPRLRGRQFEVEDDLEEALDGEIATEFSDGRPRRTCSSTAWPTGSCRSTCRSDGRRRHGRRRLRDLRGRRADRGPDRPDAARRAAHRRRHGPSRCWSLLFGSRFAGASRSCSSGATNRCCRLSEERASVRSSRTRPTST